MLRRPLAPSDLPPARADGHPLIELLLARRHEGSRRGERADGAVIALAIEGGGLRGVVSAGMCLLLEKAGLIAAIDVIYGTSSGALNGSFTAAGQAALGVTNYLDVANPQFANPLRLLSGRPLIDFDFLFDELIRRRKPYDLQGLAAGPSFRAMGVDLRTSALRVLGDFADVEELIGAVRVSCSLPLLAQSPVYFRGVPMADGSLLESMPYASAIAGGASHVLVLRSRPATYRKDRYPRALIEFARRSAHPAVAPLMRARPQRYNAEAEHLQRIAAGDPHLLQIAPAPGVARVAQFERSGQAVRAALQEGVAAAARSFGLSAPEVLWQPEIYTGS